MTAARIYPGVVVSVHDGDTLTVDLSIFPALTYRADVRLAAMNARELKEPGGPEARDHLAALLPVGAPVMVTLAGVDKYGSRWDASVITAGVDVSTRMIADGYAAAWNGHGVKPVAPWPLPNA